MCVCSNVCHVDCVFVCRGPALVVGGASRSLPGRGGGREATEISPLGGSGGSPVAGSRESRAVSNSRRYGARVVGRSVEKDDEVPYARVSASVCAASPIEHRRVLRRPRDTDDRRRAPRQPERSTLHTARPREPQPRARHGDTGARGGPRAGGEGRGRLAQPQASIVFGRPSSVPRIRVQGIKQNTTREGRRDRRETRERRAALSSL